MNNVQKRRIQKLQESDPKVKLEDTEAQNNYEIQPRKLLSTEQTHTQPIIKVQSGNRVKMQEYVQQILAQLDEVSEVQILATNKAICKLISLLEIVKRVSKQRTLDDSISIGRSADNQAISMQVQLRCQKKPSQL